MRFALSISLAQRLPTDKHFIDWKCQNKFCLNV